MGPKKPEKILLIGFMGTGKSTVGKLIASKLGWSIVDSDSEIVHREQRTISEIFAAEGESYFRSKESLVLADLLDSPHPTVIATGGGIVLQEKNRELMLAHGFVASLQADKDEIIRRVMEDTERPLLQGNVHSRVESLLKAREGAYDFAHCIIDTTGLGADEVAERVLSQYREG